MKRITILSVLLVLIIPFIFSSCEPEEKDEPKFEEGIPSTGIYFKAKIGDVVWEGDNFPEMFAKTEPQGAENRMFDFVTCTDYEDGITTIRNRAYVHVNVKDDGSFSNYRTQYVKNKSYNPAGYFNFDEWMESNSGTLKIIKNENGKITAKYTGVLKPVNNYADEVKVIFYFQEFPINPVYAKNIKLN